MIEPTQGDFSTLYVAPHSHHGVGVCSFVHYYSKKSASLYVMKKRVQYKICICQKAKQADRVSDFTDGMLYTLYG